MQKSISARDFILYSLLVIVMLLLVLLMYQVDRQWSRLSEMQSNLSDQAKDLRALRTTLTGLKSDIANTDFSQLQGKGRNTEAGKVPSAFQRAWEATQKEDYAQGDWSVDSFALNLKTISPLVSTDKYASDVQSFVQESLAIRDPDTLEWTGLLAKSWKMSEDGLSFTFQLRDDVTFSDGVKMTAKDVVFSYEFMMNPKIRAPGLQSYYDSMKSVKATGDYEVVFEYKEPYFKAFEMAAGLSIMPEHFYKEFVDKPNEYNESKGLLLGSGPYRLSNPKSWTPDQGGVELIRNERYWGAVQPSYDRIFWKIIQNDSARLTTFRNGEIDLYHARPVEYQKLKDDEQIKANSQNFEYMSPVGGYSYIAWNQERMGKATRFADKRVRQAMTYLTDREKINNEIQLGYAELAVSPFSPRSKQHNPDLLPRKYNLEKAKQLLAEAGFEDRNKDGVIEDEAGNSFEFSLTYFQDNEDTKRMVLLLKDIYAKAGIKLTPNPQEWPVMTEKLDKKDFDAITLGWTSGLETDINQMFHSSETKANGNNFINYRSKELDSLIEQARRTVDETERMKIWQKAERVMYDDQPYTFLMRRKTLLFMDKRIKNLGLTKIGLNSGLLPIETYVPLAAQKYTK